MLFCDERTHFDTKHKNFKLPVKKAAKLAVYDEIMINVKNHQMPPTILVLVAWMISIEEAMLVN